MLALLASISSCKSASSALEVDEREASQPGQTEVANQDDLVRQLFHLSALKLELLNVHVHGKANLARSPITHIFGGRFGFRSPVRGPNRPDPAPTEDWRSLHLDIEVRVFSFLLVLPAWMSLR